MVSAAGGRNGSLVCRLSNSSSTLVGFLPHPPSYPTLASSTDHDFQDSSTLPPTLTSSLPTSLLGPMPESARARSSPPSQASVSLLLTWSSSFLSTLPPMPRKDPRIRRAKPSVACLRLLCPTLMTSSAKALPFPRPRPLAPRSMARLPVLARHRCPSYRHWLRIHLLGDAE